MLKLIDIQTLLDNADHAYYTLGKEIMDDSRYDKLKSELKVLNPADTRLSKVGSSVRDTILQKKKHAIPMGSQDKATTKAEFYQWVTANNLQNVTIHASHKMDGCSMSLEYSEGRLVSGVSRGDGLEGEDVTANAVKFSNLPPTAIRPNGKVFSGFVRGEVILTVDDWKELDADSNPRNLAGGIIRRKDGSESEYLKFYAFRMFDADGEIISDLECDMSDYLLKMGFDIAPYMTGKPDDVWAWYEQVHAQRPTLKYWIDGIVMKVNDLDKQFQMGDVSDNCPKGQIAVKFPAIGATTALNQVTWQVGSTGMIAPVANFNTVRIGGTNVSNATLCNMDYIKTNDIHINDQIYVVKAGDVIPRVQEVRTPAANRIKINAPTVCPCCGGAVGHKNNVGGDDSTAIYCLNETCFAVVCGRIEKYTKSLDIQGVGSNVIESMVKDLQVNSPADLYLLKDIPGKLANLILNGGSGVRLGEKRADKIIAEVESKRALTLSDFLGSLGIFGLGKRRVVIIQNAIPGLMDNLDDWMGDKLVKHAIALGVPNIAERIHNEILHQKDMIDEFIINGVTIIPPVKKKEIKPGDKVICITGTLSRKKSFYYELMEKKGFIGTDVWSGDVTHLVAADPTNLTGKLKKAQKKGIPILSENDLMQLLQS
jgi:DNA ligase (NAD+)